MNELNPAFKEDRKELCRIYGEFKQVLCKDVLNEVKGNLNPQSPAHRAEIAIRLIDLYGKPVSQVKPHSVRTAGTVETLSQSSLFRLFGSPQSVKELKANTKKLLVTFHPDRESGSEEVYAELTAISKRLEQEWEELTSLPTSHPRLQRICKVKADTLGFDSRPVFEFWR